LDEAFWFQEGPGVRNWQFTDQGIKLLNVGNILKTGAIDLAKTDRHLSEDEVKERYSHFLADAGDLVIASSGISIDADELLTTRGAFIEEQHLPLCMNTSTIRFKAVEGASDLRFLKHWLQSHEFRLQITREVTGIAQKNFGPSHLKRLRVSLPPLAEQKRIAGILDAADRLRAKRRESLAQLDTLLQSTFLDMFGDPVTNPRRWEEQNFGLLARGSFRNGLSPSTNGLVDGEVLTLSAITRGRFDFGERKSAHFDKIPSASQMLSVDTFLICRGNGNKQLVGAGEFPDRGSDRVCFPDTMIGVTVDPKVLTAAYLRSVWSSRRVRTQIERGARTTNGTHKVNQQVLSSVVFPLPPPDLQRRFAAIVESIEQQKIRQLAHLAELDTLFASLQSRAFRGDL
jgi:type I restriction enzyme S subunit